MVTTSHVYESLRAAGTFFKRVFFEETCFGLPNHVCYVSGLPQAFFFLSKNDMFFLKRCVLVRSCHLWSILFQYLSIFVNVRYCVCTYLLCGTAYCTVLHTYLAVPYRTIMIHIYIHLLITIITILYIYIHR